MGSVVAVDVPEEGVVLGEDGFAGGEFVGVGEEGLVGEEDGPLVLEFLEELVGFLDGGFEVGVFE